jgi:signal transduction histidine kinase
VPTASDDRSKLLAHAEEAQRALQQRPSFSVRSRLAIGFGLWFLLSLGITVTSIVLVTCIKDKLRFLEAAESYMFEVQQARRFEKNFFLYGTNLDDAIGHVEKAHEVLEIQRPNLEHVVGAAAIDSMAAHLSRYEDLLGSLRGLDPLDPAMRPTLDRTEGELRVHGGSIVSSAEELVRKERRVVDTMLTISQRSPIPFLVLLGLLIVYLGYFIGRQMLAPLNRMMLATRRIAEGDFTPITPQRKYHDEFSELAMALNHMMHQLVQRQDLLVRAHKLKAVGTLTAGIAHELNNPINNIMLTACVLDEDYHESSDDERIEMIRDLVAESERAQRIVRNLLDFARETEPDVEPLDVCELVTETIELAANQIRLAKIKVKTELESELPPVFGDAQQLKQVFLNHVLNAVDAMPDGGTLTISLDNSSNRSFVTIEFADTGTGIPDHQLDDIFDPFFTTKAKSKGTGLGLSVSLGIVKKHGGDIQVSSRVGRGTVFTVLLPAARVPADLSTTADDDELIG